MPALSVTLGAALLGAVLIAGSWTRDSGGASASRSEPPSPGLPLPGGTPAQHDPAQSRESGTPGAGGGTVRADSDQEEGGVAAASLDSAKEVPERNGRFQLPLVRWYMVTDRYGAPRGKGLVHGGIDLALDGFPKSRVFAACEGTVSVPDTNKTYGNHVIVDCGEGWSTLYGHLSEVLVAPGQAASFETVLGLSGSTGFSTGEHLHFEIRYQGSLLNPEKYLDFHIAPGAPLTYDTSWLETPTATPTFTPTPDFGAVPPWLKETPIPTKTPTPTNTVPPTATPTQTPTPVKLTNLVPPGSAGGN